MRFGTYLRSHLIRICCSCLLIAMLCALLPLMGAERDETVLIALLAAILELAGLLWEWARERRFMEEIAELGDMGTGALDGATNLEEPSYPEGEIAWQAIQNVTRAARQEAAASEDAMHAYRDYIETWVHEVKTPLAAARLMIANNETGELRPFSRELDRIDACVEQALYFARSSSVEQDYLIRSCQAKALVTDAVKSRARALIEAGMGIDLLGLEGAAGTLEIFCDPKWMDFILGQLIDNAIRYRAIPSEDGRKPQLSFAAELRDEGTAAEKVVLSVADNGCGIAAADLPRIFERGFTGMNGRTHGHSTGMGLYLVRSLCEKMGLSVVASSEEGVGTAISIIFPRERSHEALSSSSMDAVH